MFPRHLKLTDLPDVSGQGVRERTLVKSHGRLSKTQYTVPSKCAVC